MFRRALLGLSVGGACGLGCYKYQTQPNLIALAKARTDIKERSFIAIKPDGVTRGLVGDIIARFEKRGYKLVGMKMTTVSPEFAAKHYADLADKPFFPNLCKFFSSGPLVAMVWEGKDVVKQGRSMLGATNPLASAPGSIRGDLCIDVGRNICHGSDSVESAEHEIALWFKAEELQSWEKTGSDWVYE
eukprot:NODE_588_length_794_cov_282.822819_g524_i0.p1 GENE.NODE_588_length_794_cov_282.822819_g524_i0~~NODE_588_length_794_cov_282.822819_g524_i0.p1  ORF type:complete len:188 (-),score=40.17 NODE_588_length_794_cov_282.822819_g524_i0:172-735(-)